MNRQDLQLVQQMSDYPALTITLPTHRTSPENRQDPIRVKNLVEQGVNRLLETFSKREIEPLLTRLEKLAEGIDYRHTQEGLALFVSRDFDQAFHMPYPLKERVVVDKSFFTRDLVFAMNRTPRYWTLALSEKPARLFEGTGEHLVEVLEGGFPLTHEGPGGDQPLPGGHGIEPSALHNEYLKQFCRAVDTALKPFLAAQPLPVALVGVDRIQATFNEVADHKSAIVACLTGSHDKTSASELGKLVWPLVEAGLAERRGEVMGELDRAMGEQKVASGVTEVWRMAHEGRGRILLVEEAYQYPGQVDESGLELSAAPDGHEAGAIEDAVDDVIEKVLSMDGRVVFVDDGQLEAHQGIALILRY